MPISFQCSSCQAKYQTGEANIGKKTRCPKCKAVIVVQPLAVSAPVQKKPAVPEPQSAKKTARTQTPQSVKPVAQADLPKTQKVTAEASTESGVAEASPKSPVFPASPKVNAKAKVAAPKKAGAGKTPKGKMPKVKSKVKARISQEALHKLSEAAKVGTVHVDKEKVKSASGQHESPLSKMKVEKVNRMRIIAMSAIGVVIVAVILAAFWESIFAKREDKKADEELGYKLTGTEPWFAKRDEMKVGDWVEYFIEFDEQGLVKKEGEFIRYEITSKNEDGSFQIRETRHDPSSETEPVATDRQYTFDFDQVADRFLLLGGVRSDISSVSTLPSFQVSDALTLENVSKVDTRQALGIETVTGTIWYHPSIPLWHELRREFNGAPKILLKACGRAEGSE